MLLATLAGWINEHQQAVIEYLREENRVLKEQLGARRLRLTDHPNLESLRGDPEFEAIVAEVRKRIGEE